MTFVAGLTVLVFVAAPVAYGQVYKCTDASGKTVYSDTQCQPGSKPIKLPNEARETTTPQVCAELQDEIQRLTAASERSGKPVSNRAKNLKKTYRARCAGITLSRPSN